MAYLLADLPQRLLPRRVTRPAAAGGR